MSVREASKTTGRSKCKPLATKYTPTGNGKRWNRRECRILIWWMKAVSPMKELGTCSWRILRGLRGQHVVKDYAVKARTHSGAA
jgi:hypothetical protein